MSLYTFTQAAKELGVTRQTVYSRVNRQPGAYTVTQDGKRLITLHGIGILRSEIRKKDSDIDSKETQTPEPDVKKNNNIIDLIRQIDTLQARVKELEEQLTEEKSLRAEAEKLQAKAEGYAEGIKESIGLSTNIRQPRRFNWFGLFPRKQKEETSSK